MSAPDVDILWEEAFPASSRPQLYSGDNRDNEGFLPLTVAEDFRSDGASYSHLQLFTTTLNNQLALKAAQEEYLALSRQIANITGKDAPIRDPQALLDPEEYEERKEATLYGYKYEAPKPCLFHNGLSGGRTADDISEQEKRDVRFLPDPFTQGGFVPNDRQYKGSLAKAKDRNNVDGWKPVRRDGKLLIPRQQRHHDEYNMTYIKRNVDENGEIIRPDSAGSDDSLATPSKAVDKRLTRTRFGGRKVPPTREASETPSFASTPSRKRPATPAFERRDGTPASKRFKITGSEQSRTDRPKHPNQYTKAREAAARAAAEAAAAGIPPPVPKMPDWSKMTPEELRARKWTDEELIDSLKKDHSWLHAEGAKALEWKDKILNGINPVRSWSMVKKWAEWRRDNKDKRPRKKELTPLVGDGASSPARSITVAAEEAWEIKRERTEETNEEQGGTPRRSLRNR